MQNILCDSFDVKLRHFTVIMRRLNNPAVKMSYETYKVNSLTVSDESAVSFEAFVAFRTGERRRLPGVTQLAVSLKQNKMDHFVTTL